MSAFKSWLGVLVFVFAITFSLGKISAQPSDNKPVCPGPAREGSARCHALVVTDSSGTPKATTLPSGYGPAQLLGAYSLPAIVYSATTIAIVDAYNHPNIFSDLNIYSQTYGIKNLNSCSVSTGTPQIPCFQKVDQRGGTNYPKNNAGWALEISLDVEVAHAICQNCNILLVEADSNSYADLMAAVDRARLMGAKVISNSYGSSEFSGETAYDSFFKHPDIAFTFSSGDNGYGATYPAASPWVTAVGGTTLYVNSDNSYQSESVWSGAGSGCSAYENKPAWQTDSGCPHRTIADVSAVANPNTGAAVYDSVRYQGKIGWFKVGGTSLSSPLIAAVYALSGNLTGQTNSLPYSSLNSLHDITSGSNGSCSTSYLCTAGSGYDGPTGLGTPIGITAF